MAITSIAIKATEVPEVKRFLDQVEDIICAAAICSKKEERQLLKQLDEAYSQLLADIKIRVQPEEQ